MPNDQSIGQAAIKIGSAALDLAVAVENELQSLGLSNNSLNLDGGNITVTNGYITGAVPTSATTQNNVTLSLPNQVIALNASGAGYPVTYTLPAASVAINGYRYKFVVMSGAIFSNLVIDAGAYTILGGVAAASNPQYTGNTPCRFVTLQSSGIVTGDWVELIYLFDSAGWFLSGSTQNADGHNAIHLT